MFISGGATRRFGAGEGVRSGTTTTVRSKVFTKEVLTKIPPTRRKVETRKIGVSRCFIILVHFFWLAVILSFSSIINITSEFSFSAPMVKKNVGMAGQKALPIFAQIEAQNPCLGNATFGLVCADCFSPLYHLGWPSTSEAHQRYGGTAASR